MSNLLAALIVNVVACFNRGVSHPVCYLLYTPNCCLNYCMKWKFCCCCSSTSQLCCQMFRCAFMYCSRGYYSVYSQVAHTSVCREYIKMTLFTPKIKRYLAVSFVSSRVIEAECRRCPDWGTKSALVTKNTTKKFESKLKVRVCRVNIDTLLYI